MTEVAGISRRMTFARLSSRAWRRAAKVAAASAAWARAERHAFFAAPTAGAFHGETRPPGGYETQIRSSWGRP